MVWRKGQQALSKVNKTLSNSYLMNRTRINQLMQHSQETIVHLYIME